MGNLYTSKAYLDVAKRTFHAGRPCEIADFRLGDRVFRLLASRPLWGALGMRPLPTTPFLDMHEPLGDEPSNGRAHALGWLTQASHGIVTADEFQARGLGRDYLAAPTVLWEGLGAWEDYVTMLRGRSKHVREDLRHMRRLHEMLGGVEFRVDDVREDVLPTSFAWKSRQMLETLGWDAFAEERNRRFFGELRAAGLLTASTLRAGDRLLATWLGAIHEGRWYGWIFGHDHDPALRKLSVGRHLVYRMLEESRRLGHREFDFSIGDQPYKWTFATHARLIAPLGTPPPLVRARRAALSAISAFPGLESRLRAARDFRRTAARERARAEAPPAAPVKD